MPVFFCLTVCISLCFNVKKWKTPNPTYCKKRQKLFLKKMKNDLIYHGREEESLFKWNVVSASYILFLVSFFNLIVVSIIHFVKFPGSNFPYFFTIVPLIGIIISFFLNNRYFRGIKAEKKQEIIFAEKNENFIKRISVISIIWIFISTMIYLILLLG